MKYLYLLLLAFAVFSCKNDAIDENTENSDFLAGISKAQIDSIKKSEAAKPIILQEATAVLDSATSIKLMLPISNYLDEYSFSSNEVEYNDIDTLSVDYTEEYFATLQIKSNLTEADRKEYVSFEKSKNPNLFTIAKVKKLNEIDSVIYEDKTSILYEDDYGSKKLYYRNYLPEMGFYVIYQAEIPKYADPKMQYSELFSYLNKAKNFFNYTAINPQNLTWQNIKPTISAPELSAISQYYSSFSKEIKYFLTADKVQIYKIGDERFSIFRNEYDTKNSYDMTENLANTNFDGTFEDLDGENNLVLAMENVVFKSDILIFERRISEHTILMKTSQYENPRDNSEKMTYFTITSIKVPNGQFYLTYVTNSSASSIPVYMNEYFSTHLKL